MKKILAIFSILCLLAACKTEEKLNVNFTMNPSSIYQGDQVSFQAQAVGGSGEYIYQWTIGDEVQEGNGPHLDYSFFDNGVVVITLYAMDSKNRIAQRIKAVEIKPAKDPEYGDLTVEWVARMDGYNSMSSVAVADDGSVYATCRDNHLYKFSSTGALVWRNEIFKAKANPTSSTYGTPSIDSDGTIFIGAGSGNEGSTGSAGDGTFKAYNPNGTLKWSYSGWWRQDGSNPAPTCTGTIAAIGSNNVYFGCTGSNGIIASINKATGARNGFTNPTGGVRSGLAITANGMVVGGAGYYGVFGMSQAALDGGSGSAPLDRTEAPGYYWTRFRVDGDENFPSVMYSQFACLNVNGTECVAGVGYDYISTKVYCINASTGQLISTCRIDDTGDQEQGGCVVDANGNVVAALSCGFGEPNGGIVVVKPSNGDVVSRYKIYEKVSGSPAVDAAGNIHFGTEGEDDDPSGMGGSYYVIKPKSGSTDCDLIVKRDLAELIHKDGRYPEFDDMKRAKIWSSPIIGDDGKIYICFSEGYDHTYGGVICLRFDDDNEKGITGCHGPANSPWPMVGANRRHTYNRN